MKIFYVNLDVGSGIAYVGNIFLDWLKNIEGIELYVHSDQDCIIDVLALLRKKSPDLIISNESYPRIRSAVVEYLKLFPNAKLLFLSHSWQEISLREKVSKEFNEFISLCDKIFCLNVIPERMSKELNFVDNFYHPISPEIFNITKPWSDRQNKFVIFGTINPIKLSRSFIDEIKATDIQIDCYGSRWIKDYPGCNIKEYNTVLDSCPNICYKGAALQSEVPALLNQYKYFVMPHDGDEPFNLSLLQAIFCGTIPIISNDLNSRTYDHRWLDWAEGFYYSCNTSADLINNLVLIDKDNPNLEDESVSISENAKKKFDYNRFKTAFENYVKSFIKKNEQCVMGREQFINSRVGPCGAIRNDAIYPIGYHEDFSGFKKRAITIANNYNGGFSYNGDSDTYSVEQYAGFTAENLENRGAGESIFLLKLVHDKWTFYKNGKFQFETHNANELEEKFKEARNV